MNSILCSSIFVNAIPNNQSLEKKTLSDTLNLESPHDSKQSLTTFSTVKPSSNAKQHSVLYGLNVVLHLKIVWNRLQCELSKSSAVV